MEGKRRRRRLKKGRRCRAGKDWVVMVAGGGRLQSLQGEKSCLHLHGCSASRDKVSGFATPNDDGRFTLAWSGGVRRGQNNAKPILLIPKANGNAHAAMGGTLYQS